VKLFRLRRIAFGCSGARVRVRARSARDGSRVRLCGMVEIDLEYVGGLRCSAVHGPSGATLITDAPLDNHGQGRSFSPTDLVATALGACMMTVMGIVAERHGVTLDGAKVHVEKEMVAQPTRRIGSLKVELTLPGKGVDASTRTRLEAAANACPVHHSLHPDVRCELKFTWTD
jgi:putative redox protein